MVELKQLKKFAVTPEGRSQAFSIKDCAVMIKVLTWLRNQLFLTDRYKWDFWITTVGGLIVAMILQVFYNYCIAKIESIVNDMEDASVTLLDILVKYNQKH